MRKLHALFSVVIFTLTCFHTVAQNVPDSCRANFETQPSTSNPLGKYFIAQPWHNHNKKPVRICWNFGDNHDTCIQYSTTYTGAYGVYHVYAHASTYNVCVKILYDGGCQSYYCKPVNVGTPDSCKADFERLPSPTNNPLRAYFKALPWNNNDKKPEQICWNFGDNHDTCINYSPTNTNYVVGHNYAHSGTYNVCVRIKYQGGCIAYKCREEHIGIQDSCKADFERLSSPAYNPLRVYYKALPWHNNNKKPEQICWNFGDNHDTCINYSATSTNYIVGHTYAHSGTYNVCVRIKYQGGCIAYKCKEEHIGIQDSCKADFERLSYSGSNPLSAYYKALPWHNNNKKPEQICWNFGDNHDTCINYSTTSTNYVVGHIYAHEGTYNVCVRIKYQGGCIAYKCKEIEIEDENKDHCRADFEKLNSNANDPLQAYYKALPWNSEQKKPKRICWTFGDGKDTCIQYAENYTGYYVVSHHYSHTGSYEVCVTINYYGECEAKKCRTILITTSNDSCHVHLFEISPAITSLTRTFYVVTTASNGNPIRVCWYFGDGKDTCIVATNSTPPSLYITHTYPAPGEYHACVKVLFQNGCLAEDCHKVIIRSLTGICGGYYTDSLDNPHTYTFKGFSIHNPNDAVLSYRWTFGDGTSGTGQKITHTFSQPGVYRVCLLINTEKGCETRICNDVRVGGTTQSTLQLSPNPVINNLHLVFYSNHNEAVTIRIFAAGGVAVRTYVRNAVIGANTWDFDVSTLISGVYLLTVESPNQFASGIFFKL